MGYFDDKQSLVSDIFNRYPGTPQGRRSALMPLLREVQNAHGYVSDGQMHEIAALIGSTATEVRSVMSFYSAPIQHRADGNVSPPGVLAR